MAQPQTRTLPPRMSFAKIAAMPPPAPPATNNQSKQIPKQNKKNEGHVDHAINVSGQPANISTKVSTTASSNVSVTAQSLPLPIESVDSAIARLSLGQEDAKLEQTVDSRESTDSFEEERSQLSTSSLNKNSFDTKSMTSITTFAMDDPEGIRPDESASVRAADDDVPQIGLSRNSSFQHEVEASQNAVKYTKQNTAAVTIPGRRYATLTNPPRFGTLPVSPVLEARVVDQRPMPPVMQVDEPRDSTTSANIAPDEKLLDALASAKDRLPLLQLEEKVLAFISGRASDVMELPPQNSFARLLAHKLADYYSLAHHINEDNSSVRMFRTVTRGIPTPLSHLAKSIPVGSAPIPGSTAVKIMRRANLGPRNMSAGNSTAPSSSVASKATSENGMETNSEEGVLSPGDGTPNRDKAKLTREEREAQYKAARDRIFGDFHESLASESVSTGENSTTMSRSSSSSGKRKSRKSKQPKDDSFEARSAFVPSYTPISGQYNSSIGDPGFFDVYGGQTEAFSPNIYANTPTQAFAGFDQTTAYVPQPGYGIHETQSYQHGDWQGMHSPQANYYPFHGNSSQQQQSPMGPPPNMMPHMAGHFMQQPAQGMHQNQSWLLNQYPGYGPVAGPPNVGWQSYGPPANIQPSPTPYQMNQGFSPVYGNQLQRAGIYSNPKSLFNPQTRSFVPGSNGGRGGGRNGRKKNNTNKHMGGTGSGASSAVSGSSSPKPKEDSLQQKYGAPASLPKKPPTSETASGFTTSFGLSAPATAIITSNNGPLIVNGTSDNTA